MFTGLIEEIGTVKSFTSRDDGIILTIAAREVLEGVTIGDSIAIDGACQTVTAFSDDTFSVFASKVTASVTTLGGFGIDQKVNLERALTIQSRLGGHIVQGHVDGTGLIRSLKKDAQGMEINITTSNQILRYIVEKGSVSVDGISLTVVSLSSDGFVLYIIPETISKTTLPEKKSGMAVNIEVDILAKYVEKMIGAGTDGSSDESLKRKLLEGGFM